MERSFKMIKDYKLGYHFLDTAIMIAMDAHRGQKRFNGEPFILHPLRLMMKMETISEKIVAVMHDTLEDSDITEEYLRSLNFQSYNVLIPQSILMLTNINTPYETYIRDIRPWCMAKKVKIADLEDNLNPIQLPALNQKDLDRLQKHYKAYRYLKFNEDFE